MANQIPILAYHRVHRDEDVSVPNDGGRVDLSEFRRQMDYVAEQRVSVVTHADIARWICEGEELPDRAVALDFDDNRLNIFDNAYPILRERGFRGTVFTVTDLADQKPVADMQAYPAMNWGHLRQLRDSGWCIAPHTKRHPFLTGPRQGVDGLDEAAEEMAGSLQRVRDETGVDAPYFAYPGGCWNEDLETLAKTLFKTARLWQTSLADHPPLVSRGCDPYRLVGINICLNMSFAHFCQIIDAAS